MLSKRTKILLLIGISIIGVFLAVPTFLIIKDLQNDMPLREYVKETLLRRIKTDIKRFFTFSDNHNIELPVLYLYIDEAELHKLEKQRINRIEKIETKDIVSMGQNQWKYVNAKIVYNNEEHSVKIRIRGDMPSNYNKGIEKASLRFNIESNTALLGKRKLSLVRCFLENNFYGYLFSQYFDKEKFISNDVMFIRLFFNGEDTGICFLQEGFSKELVESSDYREGAILRFKNDCIDNNGDYNSSGMPELVAYNEGKTMKDTALSNSYTRAITKFDLLKAGKISVGQCFNVKKFSKYLALCDIFLAHHSYVCHNAKLYFNPVNDKFEPIAWDPSNFVRYKIKLPVLPGFTNVAGEIYGSWKNYPLHHIFYSDTFFVKEFNKYLHRYANDSSIPKFVRQHEEIIAYLDPILYRQRFQEQFNPELLYGNIRSIQHWFTTDNRFTARIFREEGILVVNSTLPLTLQITKLKLDSANIISVNKILLPFQSDTIHFAKAFMKPGDNKFTLYSSVYGIEEEKKYKGNIFNKMDQYNSPVITEKTDSTILKFDSKSKTISFKNTNTSISKDLYIPPGYKLIISEGSNIKLTNHSNIVCESAVSAIGTESKKIHIYSDGTGGFFVKNAEQQSQFEYVEFDNLSYPQNGNWSLTGAITFYESDVFFTHCVFKNNFSEDAVNIIRSSFTIRDCFVSHTSSDAIDIDFSSGKIINTVIENTKNDGLDFSASHVLVDNVQLSHIGDKAVSGGENTFADLQNITIRDSFIGITSKDKSIIKSENIFIEDTKYSLTSYQKKTEYGPATLIVNHLSGEKSKDFLIEKKSLLILDGDTINGSEKNVYANIYPKN